MINIKDCKKYIINLEKRPDRLSQTLKNLNNKNYYDITRFNAFEIKSVDSLEMQHTFSAPNNFAFSSLLSWVSIVLITAAPMDFAIAQATIPNIPVPQIKIFLWLI